MKHLLLFMILAATAAAAPITLSFVSSSVSGAPGDTVTLSGTLTNTSGGDLNINGASLTLAVFDPSASDLTDFILNATGLLTSGASLGPVNLFTVSIPAMFANGMYAGTLIVQGGATVNDDTNLGSADFQINVQSQGGSPAPEPATWLLAATSLTGLFFMRRRLS